MPKPAPHRLLLTGFEPFDHRTENPSARIIEHLAANFPPGLPAELRSIVLPVSARRMPAELLAALENFRPHRVLCIGQSPAAHMRVERVAFNQLSFAMPDNDGLILDDEPIAADGPDSYPATLLVRAMRDAILGTGVPCEFSDDAGRYICNQAMYLALRWAGAQPWSPQAGFLHVPALTVIDLPRQVQAVGAAIQ